MKKTIILFEVALIALVLCCLACAAIFFGEDPPGQPVYQRPDWPAGLADLLSRGGRIYSCSMGWLGGDEHSFYFSGDTDDFNWFVEQYAKLKGVSRTVGVHPGRGEARRIMDKQPVGPFDWEVGVRTHWAESGRNLDIGLSLWVGGQVTLEKLRVPLNLEVRAAGEGEQFKEIQKFVADHGAKRKEAEKKESRSPPPARESEPEKPEAQEGGLAPTEGAPNTCLIPNPISLRGTAWSVSSMFSSDRRSQEGCRLAKSKVEG